MFFPRLFPAIVVLLGSCGLLRSETPPTLRDVFAKLRAGETQTVVTYGTSLTAQGAWVPLMQKWFDEKFPGQVKVVNRGGPGQNSDWGAAQLSNKVLAEAPDVVFLEFSYNDAHRRFQLTPEHARKNLEAMISGIQAANASTVIVLQTMNVPWDPPAGKGMKDSATNRPELEVFNENYRASAREHHLTLIDNVPGWLKIRESDFPRYQALVPDGSHPSKAGSEAVTWPNIRAVLEEAALLPEPSPGAGAIKPPKG